MVNGTDFWGVMWSIFWVFAFVAYVFALFAVISDLFRDHKLNGWWKAVWIVFLVLVPFLTLLVYLIARGPGMQERARQEAEARHSAADAYIRHVAGTRAPADEIMKAKALLDAGTITTAEYETIKSHALRLPPAG